MIELFVIVGGLVTVALIHRRFDAFERRLASLEALARGAGTAFLETAPASPGRPGLPIPTVQAGLPPGPGSALQPGLPPGPGSSPGPEPEPAEAFARAEVPPGDETPAGPSVADAVPTPSTVPPIAALPPDPAGRRRGFEETLGTRWAVWVGGLALALGGVFLVRYSIEQDLIGPRLRVALGLALAASLVLAGEWLRRREAPLAIAAAPNADIPAILTAAGTSTAFASVYAAYGLYGLVGPAFAFVALGIVSLVTMAAAILHGPALAALGLLAALASPLLVDSQDPSPLALVLYLAFAVGSAYGVARLRLWRWLAVSAAAGAWLWGVVFLVSGWAWQTGSVAHVLVQLALAILFLAIDPYRRATDAESRTDRMVAGVLIAFAVLSFVIAADLNAGLSRPLFIGSVASFMMAAAWKRPAAASGLVAATIAIVGMMALWPVAREAAVESSAIVRDLSSAPMPEALSTFLTAGLVLNGLLILVGFGRLAIGRDLRLGVAAWYAGAATLGPLAALVVAYWRVTAFDRSVAFALAAGALGAFFAVAATALQRLDRGDSPAMRLALGAFASAAVAALAAGLTFAFDRGVLTVALALAALGTAFVAERAAVPALRYVVGALGIAVAGRLAWDPTVMQGEIGATPILNWLLWGYGVPALAFGLSAHILSRQGRDWVVRFVESLSFLFAALLVFLEIRHALHAGDPFAARSNHLEAGLVVTEALGFTLLMVRLNVSRPDSLYRIGSLVFGALSILGAGAALLVRYNPYLSGERVIGGDVFNSLWPAYLIPAIMAALVAAASRADRPRPFVLAAAGLALLLELAFAGLEVRRLFHGPRIGFLLSTSQAELWCYSLVLLANGLVLLAVGILRGWRDARLASVACILLAVVKVFVVDLSALEGLTRALSFVGLGLALVAIGFVYQRLLAPHPRPAE